MNKAEALQAMSEGHKVTHRYFLKDEFIEEKDGKIVDEGGFPMDGRFWDIRKNPNWDKDWKIYNG